MPHWEEAPGKTQDMLEEELEEVSGEREVWASLLRLLPPRPGPDKRKKMHGWMAFAYVVVSVCLCEHMCQHLHIKSCVLC